MDSDQMERKLTLWQKVAVAFVRSKAGSWFYVNVAPMIDRPLMRLTKGRLSIYFIWTTDWVIDRLVLS